MSLLLSQNTFEACSIQVNKKKKAIHFWSNTKYVIWRDGAEKQTKVGHLKEIKNSQYEINNIKSACYMVLFE